MPEPRLETLRVQHPYGGELFTVSLLPDADGLTFVVAHGEKLFAAGQRTARLSVAGDGLAREDRGLALRIVGDFCRERPEFACRAFQEDNGGPIFLEDAWLFQFAR